MSRQDPWLRSKVARGTGWNEQFRGRFFYDDRHESNAQLQSRDQCQDDNKHTVEQDALTIRVQAEQHLGVLGRPSFGHPALSDDRLDGKAPSAYELRYPVVI